MPATKIREIAIPQPTDRRLIAAVHTRTDTAVHSRLSVGLDDVTVVYSYDTDAHSYATNNVVLSLVDRSVSVDASDLDESVRKQNILGSYVFGCHTEPGGGFITFAVLADIPVLLVAVPYFYQCLQDAQQREMLRFAFCKLSMRRNSVR